MNPIFIGTVKNGSIIVNDVDKFRDYLISLNDKEIQVSIGLIKKQRSNNENRYYWGVVVKLLSEVTGYNDDEMHDALRMLFLKDMTKKIPTIRSTALLTTVEFEDYMSKIRVWASQTLNCYIPEPNEVEI